MEVEGAFTALLGVEIDLPGLAQGVRLHEMPFVVHVERVVDGMVLQLGHVSRYIYDGHVARVPAPFGSGPSHSVPTARLPRWCASGGTVARMTDDALLDVLDEAVLAVRHRLDEVDDWGSGTARPGQYAIDLVADAAALAVLVGHGLGVLSEESGRHHPEREVVVVLDPVDGSTNASRRLPWYATSLCAVDGDGPVVALVVNQASGERFEAVRGAGAHCAGRTMRASHCGEMSEAIVAVSGLPATHWGWSQYRSLGAAALDLCYVGDGRLDGYASTSPHALGPWDYLGGLLICREAGAAVVDVGGRELVVLDHAARRSPVAAATPVLLDQLLQANGGQVARG